MSASTAMTGATAARLLRATAAELRRTGAGDPRPFEAAAVDHERRAAARLRGRACPACGAGAGESCWATSQRQQRLIGYVCAARVV